MKFIVIPIKCDMTKILEGNCYSKLLKKKMKSNIELFDLYKCYCKLADSFWLECPEGFIHPMISSGYAICPNCILECKVCGDRKYIGNVNEKQACCYSLDNVRKILDHKTNNYHFVDFNSCFCDDFKKIIPLGGTYDGYDYKFLKTDNGTIYCSNCIYQCVICEENDHQHPKFKLCRECYRNP